jgi:hypothetical protein
MMTEPSVEEKSVVSESKKLKSPQCIDKKKLFELCKAQYAAANNPDVR